VITVIVNTTNKQLS